VRTVRGTILVPPDVPEGRAALVLVEARDVSVMDAPSVVVAEERWTDVPIGPGLRIPFELGVPDTEAGRTLAMRAHISLDGTAAVTRGDVISVTHIPLPESRDVDGLEIPLRVV